MVALEYAFPNRFAISHVDRQSPILYWIKSLTYLLLLSVHGLHLLFPFAALSIRRQASAAPRGKGG